MGLMPLFSSEASASIIFSLIAVVSNFRVWWSVRDKFVVKHWLFPVLGLVFGMPALFLGSWLGIKIYNHIPEKIFSWLVLVMLSINALVLLIAT